MSAKRSKPPARRVASARVPAARRKPAVRSVRPVKASRVVANPAPIETPPETPGTELAVLDSRPERAFAARPLPPEPDRPLPSARRAIFFDVENTSRAAHVARLIDHLALDRLGRRTDFVAVGNWRVIGHDTARLLARHGAQLVHAAPSVGVKDWSDLRIAVSAGVWLGTARPGDVLEVVSDDRAFDAVGDVAANLGIAYRRLSYRSLAGAPAPEVEPEPVEAAARVTQSPDHRRRRGRRRGGRGRGPAPASAPAHSPARHVERPAHRAEPPSHRAEPVAPRVEPTAHRAQPLGHRAEPAAQVEAHTAPHDEIVSIVQRLIEASPEHTTTLDALANALKAHGFSRPPGSPRLITRLRRIKEIEVSRAGIITLTGTSAADVPPAALAIVDEEPERPMDEESDAEAEPSPGNEAPGQEPRRRRRSRRGGRGRRRGRPAPAATS